jgi:hypothetical protein
MEDHGALTPFSCSLTWKGDNDVRSLSLSPLAKRYRARGWMGLLGPGRREARKGVERPKGERRVFQSFFFLYF